MLSPEDISQQKELLALHRRNLKFFLEQLAQQGTAFATPGLLNSIAEARESIYRIKNYLRLHNIEVDDFLTDEETRLEGVLSHDKLRITRDVHSPVDHKYRLVILVSIMLVLGFSIALLSWRLATIAAEQKAAATVPAFNQTVASNSTVTRLSNPDPANGDGVATKVSLKATATRTQISVTTPTPTSTPTLTPEPIIPPEYKQLFENVTDASWEPNSNFLPNPFIIKGTWARYLSDRRGNRCRIALLPDPAGDVPQLWVNCQAIGEPPPTVTPTSKPTAVATPTHTPTPVPPQKHIAFSSNRDGNWEIYRMRTDGSEQERLTYDLGTDWFPRWSPDGSRIVFTSNRNGEFEVYLMNGDGSDVINLTNHTAKDWHPAWSPDGSRIVFSSTRHGNPEIYIMEADRSQIKRLTNNLAVDEYPAWSPDGSKIAFVSFRDDANGEIYVMNVDGSNLNRLTYSRNRDWVPVWSPDGSKIAFESDRDNSNISDIYIMSADGTNQRRLTDAQGKAGHAIWSPDGSQLTFHYAQGSNNEEVYILNADGSGLTNLTKHPAKDWLPSWQP